MPLLPAEPFVYPEGLFKHYHPGVGSESRWWVLHTRARAEKTVARAAHRNKIPFFLPLYQRRWRKDGRRFSAFLPLFPGYIFIYGGSETRHKLLETRCVADTLPVVDQEGLLNDLTRVYDLMTTGASMAPEAGLEPGASVVITDGPLKGLKGKITRRGTQTRLTVEVEFLRQGVSIEVPSRMVELVPACEAVAL